jgi:pSer/pThr/pTyr-binding forkhead associated (FHA) protein
MPKLVVLSEGMSGRTYEIKVDRTTVGRLEDNSFQIPEQSVSSHHCEILLRGQEIVVKDLNSTNGSYINGEKITEAVLKPGQILRLGQVEMRLENGAPPPGGTPVGKKHFEQTKPLSGVKLNDLEQGTRPVAFDKNSPFAKKSNKTALIFIIISAALGLIILAILGYVFFGNQMTN